MAETWLFILVTWLMIGLMWAMYAEATYDHGRGLGPLVMVVVNTVLGVIILLSIVFGYFKTQRAWRERE